MEEAWHALQVKSILQKLGTDEKKGLTENEAKSRLEKFGSNTLKEEKKRFRTLRLLIEQFKSYFVIMLIIATIISFWLGEVIDAITIALILIFIAVIGFVQEYRAEKALDAMKKLIAPHTKVIRDGEEKIISADEIVPGDLIVLEEGDRIPADARLIEITSLKTNEAPLTGESTPVTKKMGLVDEKTPVADRKNSLFMGTYIVFGHGKAIVTKTGMVTEFGKIAKAVQTIEEEKTPLETKLNTFAKKLAIIIVVISILIFILDIIEFGIEPKNLIQTFMTVVALAVSAVPEGLPALVIITLALGARELAKKKSLVRKLASAETLGDTTFICADKTGTLTKGEMVVEKIFTDFKTIDITNKDFRHKEKNINLLLRIGLLCNNAKLNNKTRIGDPTEIALILSALKAGMKKKELEKQYPRIDEIPFSSERKIMTTIHLINNRKVAYVKGAPEIVLKKCTHILKKGKVSKIRKNEIKEILQANEKMATEALRVLAMAYKVLPQKQKNNKNMEKELTFVGLQGMIDPPRKEAIEAVKVCKWAGIKNVMITGDHKSTAVAIATELKMMEKGSMVLTGNELDAIDDGKFEEIVENVTVYARVSPMHKLRIVKTLKKRGHIVAMTGDGVNDAPALKKADIGVAMGITGTDVSKEAADLILEDDNYATLIKAVEGGRQIYNNIRKYIRFLMSCNFNEIFVIAFAAIARFKQLPYLPAQLLWLNLVTDGPPAIALSVDTPEKDIMKRKPRDPQKGVFSGMLVFMLFSFIIQTIGCIFIFLYAYDTFGYPVANTMTFILSATFELFVVWNCRSETRSFWRMGKDSFKNKLFVASVIGGLMLTFALPYIPVLSDAFHVVPLTLEQWAITIGIASLGLFLVLPEFWMGRKIWKWE